MDYISIKDKFTELDCYTVVMENIIAKIFRGCDASNLLLNGSIKLLSR